MGFQQNRHRATTLWQPNRSAPVSSETDSAEESYEYIKWAKLTKKNTFLDCSDHIINRIIRSTVLYVYGGQKYRIIQPRFPLHDIHWDESRIINQLWRISEIGGGVTWRDLVCGLGFFGNEWDFFRVGGSGEAIENYLVPKKQNETHDKHTLHTRNIL